MDKKSYSEAFFELNNKSSKLNKYLPLYDQIIQDIKKPDPVIMELGIASGGGLEIWSKIYPNSRLIGVDLGNHVEDLSLEFQFHKLNLQNQSDWNELITMYPQTVDLLIDDSGHTNIEQLSTIFYGINLMTNGGWIVIEDLGCSFLKEFGNPSPFSILSFLHKFTSELHYPEQLPLKNKAKFFTFIKNRVELIMQANQIVALKINNYQDTKEITAGASSKTFIDYRYKLESDSRNKILAFLFRGPVVWFYRKYEANSIFHRLVIRMKTK